MRILGLTIGKDSGSVNTAASATKPAKTSSFVIVCTGVDSQDRRKRGSENYEAPDRPESFTLQAMGTIVYQIINQQQIVNGQLVVSRVSRGGDTGAVVARGKIERGDVTELRPA